jgi:hypothetical protein
LHLVVFSFYALDFKFYTLCPVQTVMFVVDKCQQRCSTYSASKQLQLCLKNGDKKLPGDSSSAIGTPSPNKPPGISFEEPAEGSQIFCVGEDDKVVA